MPNPDYEPDSDEEPIVGIRFKNTCLNKTGHGGWTGSRLQFRRHNSSWWEDVPQVNFNEDGSER